MTIEKREEAICELSKIFDLAVEGHTIQMFSGYIDSIWHQLLADEDNYIEFSINSCGHIILHDEIDGKGLPRFKEAYEAKYGKFPDIWFRNEEGVLDQELFEHYEKLGEIQASWKCSATHNCMFRIKNKPEKPDPQQENEEAPTRDAPKEDQEKSAGR